MAMLSDSKEIVEFESISLEKRETQKTLEDESFSYAMQLATGVSLPMALQSAIELGVFEVLQKADKELSAGDIAGRLPSCSDNPDASKMLDRILDLLASHSVLNCSTSRHYSMAPVAKFFATNADGVSLAPILALNNDNILYACWSQLKVAIQEGGTPFKRVYGTHLFEYPSIDSRFNQLFNAAMNNHSTIVMKKVLECYKGFKDVRRLVDVGGGLGMNINLITSKYTHVKGINFDLPHVIQHAPSYLGVEHIGGDMFESVPKGDVIFMKWILHDWGDEHCLKLMKNCYDAIPEDGKVIVFEAIVPIMPKNGVAWKSRSQMDVMMLTHCPAGKERTEKEFMDLATKAGFRGIRYECFVFNYWVIEFFK